MTRQLSLTVGGPHGEPKHILPAPTHAVGVRGGPGRGFAHGSGWPPGPEPRAQEPKVHRP